MHSVRPTRSLKFLHRDDYSVNCYEVNSSSKLFELFTWYHKQPQYLNYTISFKSYEALRKRAQQTIVSNRFEQNSRALSEQIEDTCQNQETFTI